MTKNYFAIFVLVIFASICFFTANPGMAQFEASSFGPAPVSDTKYEQGVNNTTFLNPVNRGFNYISGTNLHQFGKQVMGNVTTTNIGSPFTTPGWIGALARNTSTGVIYVNNQASPFEIWSVDTNTGVCTQVVASCTGVPFTSLTGMVWDHTTNTMYGVASSLSASQIGTINMTTGVFTPIGTASSTCTGAISIACAPNGTLFSHCLVTDNLFKWDKTSGVATLVGPLGFDANYGQDAAFDLSDGMFYLASCGPGNILRVCDTTTGSATTVIGTYSGQPSCLIVIGNMGPNITHTPLPNTQNLAGPYPVNCVIIPPGGSTITSAQLYWSRNSTTISNVVTLTQGTGNNYSGNIPGDNTTATYRYYLKATDSQGKIGYHPGGAPAAYHTFYAMSSDTSKPVITHTPLANCPRVNWPANVTCTATDLFGIDSVWVTWKKGASGAFNRFNLAKGTGDTWSGNFNSDTSQVSVGDVIYYRVVARDKSNQSNKDSTAQYNFNIINQATITIGTGTTAVSWPYYTFYMDSRTDMLYLGSEINIPTGGYITQIGFDVIAVGSPVMNGFKVLLQNTTTTSITSFTSSGWTTGYDGTYSPPGTGWQLITLQTPFYYEGGKNLLVEVCFNNSAWSTNSTVNGAAATGRNVHQHSDLSTGDGCTGITSPGTSYTQLPNVRIVINPGATGIGQIGNGVPETYSLAQNYPNPFNPTTKINFAIPKQGLVTLKVYDVLGREVANLVNEVKTAGNYIVDFDASYLSSGVYFYKLDVNGFSDVKRMMLIK